MRLSHAFRFHRRAEKSRILFSALFSLKRPEFPQLVMAHIWFSLSTSTLAIKPFAFLNSYCSKWLVIVLYLNIPCPTVVNHRFFVFYLRQYGSYLFQYGYFGRWPVQKALYLLFRNHRYICLRLYLSISY